jgi:molecular chaperone GrpE (heat shock protein)
MTLRNLEEQFKSLGVQRIDTTGRTFDPGQMEAVEITTNGNQQEGYVVTEIRAGFMKADTVYRFAQVTVKGKS